MHLATVTFAVLQLRPVPLGSQGQIRAEDSEKGSGLVSIPHPLSRQLPSAWAQAEEAFPAPGSPGSDLMCSQVLNVCLFLPF